MSASLPRLRRLLCALAFCALTGCAPSASTPPPAPPGPEYYTYDIVNTYPHDTSAFTEGLVFLNGKMYESTGLNGQSTLREEDLNSGKVLRKIDVPAEYFGEGLAILNGHAYQLTWQAQKGFVYDLATFNKEKEFTYTGEGWGMTTDGKSLIMSDGTSQIRFLDPDTFAVQRAITVVKQGVPVPQVNELEYIHGEIFANVWQTDYVLRIDPANGNVKGVIDFHGLIRPADRTPGMDVLNGIAYDAATDRIFVTGKNWPKLFEVRVRPIDSSASSGKN
jgi:glutamine cyclotransferase